ncbi:MAG: ABC transporter permease [Patescibacteria group bacterium]
MYILDNIKLATRTFRTRKLRTSLTILGISVGIGAILFLVSLGYGLQSILLDKIANLDALLTLDASTNDPSILKIDDNLIDEIKNLPNVAEVSPLKSIDAHCRGEEYSTRITLSAVNSIYFRLGGVELVKGKRFENNDDNKLILSRGALTSLGIKEEEAFERELQVDLIVPSSGGGQEEGMAEFKGNKSVSLEKKFKISGILEDSSSSLGYIPSEWISGVNFNSYDGIKVRVDKQEDLENVRNSLVEKGLSVMAISDTVDQANKIFKALQIVLALFGIVALIVSAIGMFNTMTIALLERTNEIGIMKAIGASNRDIRFLFLLESVLIGFLGGVVGILIGLAGTKLINFGFNVLASKLGGEPIDIFQTPLWFVLFVLFFSTLIGLITGVYPSERAAKLNPLMALRYK